MSVNEILEAVRALTREEQSQVKALIDSLFAQPETNSPNADERTEILHRMVERMKANPIPASAPRFTREELHERR